MLKSKLFYVVLAVVLVGAVVGVVIYARNNDKQSSQEIPVEAKETVVVDITAAGFSPATIRVAPNTKITWINRDNANHQVVSNPSAGTEAPQSLSSSELGYSANYSVILTEPGQYDYHDNLNPLLNGSIVVE